VIDQPFLLILTGPPGAGKTTVAEGVGAAFTRSIVFEADWFWASVRNGFVDPWEEASERQNQALLRASLASAARLANAGYATVLEGFFGPWRLDMFREELASVVAPVSYVVLRPSVEECLQRATARLADPRHKDALTREEPIRSLYAQYEDLGAFEGHVLDTSALGADETVSRVVSALTTRDRYGLSLA
jgi:predicted kinase